MEQALLAIAPVRFSANVIIPFIPVVAVLVGALIALWRQPGEGLSVRSGADIERIRAAVEEKLAAVGHKVYAVVNYDRFSISPELTDEYIGMVKRLMDRHYHDVTRYTSSAFLRLKLGEALSKVNVAPHLYSSVAEAQASLATK